MREEKRVTSVGKDITLNKLYMNEELGASSSYDIGLRELLVLDRKVLLYYVNGLVDDIVIVQLTKQLVKANDNEVPKRVDDIVNNRIVSYQLAEERELQPTTGEVQPCRL